MQTMRLAFSAAALAAATVASGPELAKDYFFASGRWDNIVSVIMPILWLSGRLVRRPLGQRMGRWTCAGAH